jgi:serine phosphatase RsbU (regulator of sigma subunit)
MPTARLDVTDALGQRTVIVTGPSFCIGRRESNDLRLTGAEVSRDHAELVIDQERVVLFDRGSRYGTYVNGEAVTERPLAHGDRIRLGRGGGAEMVFLADQDVVVPQDPATSSAIGDLRHVAALLEGLRALGSSKVLDDVLALVLDSALSVSGAERGFIMLASPSGQLEFKLARARGSITLPGRGFETSRKIPEEVFATGKARIVADLLDGDLAAVHTGTVALGIRNVLCVPLQLVRILERAEARADEPSIIGVLYLDSRAKGSLLSSSTRSALETLATEAAVAIENARLYRQTLEKARLDEEMRIAAVIQQALLPKGRFSWQPFDLAAATLPCRSIGGDFFDYMEVPGGTFGFALGDVAGKGPPAALLSALVQGILTAQGTAAQGPAQTIAQVNEALFRRAIESRFVTMFHGRLEENGRLTCCNAGHNPPLVVGRDRVRRLTTGGPILGLFAGVPFEEETLSLDPGECLVVFSDGVSEALNAGGDEFGEARILETVGPLLDRDAPAVLEALFAAVRGWAADTAQNDDVTALVIRRRERSAPGRPCRPGAAISTVFVRARG